jgi:hypothetical protein
VISGGQQSKCESTAWLKTTGSQQQRYLGSGSGVHTAESVKSWGGLAHDLHHDTGQLTSFSADSTMAMFDGH